MGLSHEAWLGGIGIIYSNKLLRTEISSIFSGLYKNICFRFEDSISNEKTPYALGIHLEAIQLYTCNEDWERDFVSGEDISLKMAKITNFELYLNYCGKGDEDDSVNFGEFEEDMDLAEVVQDQLERSRRNRNLIEKFCIEARVRLNKNPKKNSKPMVDVNVVIGGKFVEGRNELVDSEEGIGFFKLQKQQMNCILKYLDYSTNYTKFQTGVQKNLLANKFTKEESQRYMTLYEEYKRNAGDNRSAGEKKKAAKLRENMKDIEEKYAYETIAALRQISINRYNLDFRKEQERENMRLKIKQFEASKSGGYLSSLWGGKSEDDKFKDEQETEELRDKLNQEFEEKFKNEEQKIGERMENLLENEPIFDQDALRDMPDEWTQFLVNVVIPKLRIVLLDEDSQIEEEKSIMEIQMSGMRTKAQLGQDWQEIDLSSGKLNVIDNVTGSDIYQFMVETVFPGNQYTDGKDSLELHFENNPRFEDGEMKIRLYTKAHQYIFANMPLIKELQEFFAGGESPEEQIDLSYYTDRAKIKALEYMNAGADYIEESQQVTEYVHKGIDVDIELFAPVLVIPESITDLRNKKTLVFNLGYLRMTSEITPYHKEVDYMVVNRGEELFDKYDIKINGLQLSMIEELVDYKHWQDAKNKIDIINQISINLNVNRSIEPNHPTFPAIEVFCRILEIDIFVSDYVLANLLKIQGALMKPLEAKVEEIDGPSHTQSQDINKEKPGAEMVAKQESELEESQSQLEQEDEEEEKDEPEEAKQEEKPSGSQMAKPAQSNSNKVDQRILIIFDKMTITLGEVVPQSLADSAEYEGIIDTNRSEIPHVNILEISLEGLEIEFNNGRNQTLNLIMNRFYIKDLQLVKKIEDGIEQEAAPLIPECFQMVLSNPEIEKEVDEGSSFYTMNTKNFKTEDFKSLRGDEESIVALDKNMNNLAQLKVVVKMAGPSTDVDFIFSNLRMIVTLPILERLSKFQHKMTKLQEENTADLETKSKILQIIEESDSEDSEDFDADKDNKLKQTAMILLGKKNQKQADAKEEKGYYRGNKILNQNNLIIIINN